MDHKVYVVIGGERGIGLAVSERLSKKGKVVMSGFAESDVREGTATLKAKGIDVASMVVDIRKPEDVKGILEAALAVGTIEGVVLVAGLTPACGDWKAIFEVDVLAQVAAMKLFKPHMGPGTAFVLFASSSPYQLPREMLDPCNDALWNADTDPETMWKTVEPVVMARGEAVAPGLAYSLAKKGTMYMAQKYAVLFGGDGIRVNSVSPGIADTVNNSIELAKSMNKPDNRMWNMINVLTPSKRMGTTMEMAAVVDFLLSEDASFVSGIDILIDGACAAHMRMKKLIP
ncbi:SDR family oxidoreductase [Desulfitobacterium chlororespirans]|uniref:NAD(P)-dependent dehydrogenase, short-chain alcohol dehydrogenase family n=1 Tax=Desulfitobacterium chlororespirans DSM 11544 TaxID=1121395 RepID=A0A1M7SNQ8_9FIRM|nr:SDR family oxidoreductase [Desulfitobacterium chlororespirans]SHN60100.1 NAD(P)-dependent dehydrogenase, short-chain alcohol dehydrogenase family [Desulfitobacterium chlororespirans DSM 11544]